ncbi:hypothetical protein ACFOZ7_13580 [Natribaculum luteum]|uniref:Uncharacterized protein n=1 Tax=Natribaculum luteum TaxID=1586232 RepID=A0ABD5P0Z2_9EURY|nr:hypothetical protein [Natribaculum luteum]
MWSGNTNGDERPAQKYCLECGWSATPDEDDTVEDVSRRALEHFVETGHTVVSIDYLPPPLLDRC